MMNNEKMERLMNWDIAKREEQFAIDTKHILAAKKVFQNEGVDTSKVKDEELLTFYFNNIDTENENVFKYCYEFDNVEDVELANYLADDENAFNELIKLLQKGRYICRCSLWEYSRKRMQQGIGQDITGEKIRNLIDIEDYNGLKDTLSKLVQKPLTFFDVELFVASEINIDELLVKHSKNFGNIMSYLLQGEYGKNAFEYSKFREHTLRSGKQKEVCKKRKSTKVSVGV